MHLVPIEETSSLANCTAPGQAARFLHLAPRPRPGSFLQRAISCFLLHLAPRPRPGWFLQRAISCFLLHLTPTNTIGKRMMYTQCVSISPGLRNIWQVFAFDTYRRSFFPCQLHGAGPRGQFFYIWYLHPASSSFQRETGPFGTGDWLPAPNAKREIKGPVSPSKFPHLSPLHMQISWRETGSLLSICKYLGGRQAPCFPYANILAGDRPLCAQARRRGACPRSVTRSSCLLCSRRSCPPPGPLRPPEPDSCRKPRSRRPWCRPPCRFQKPHLPRRHQRTRTGAAGQ